MTKKISIILIVFAVLIGGNFVFAKNDKSIDIPEQDGVYDVPGHPEMKVKVFVHREKPAKPGKPTPPMPVEQCGLTDPDSDAFVYYAGWKLPSTWTYSLNPGSVPSSVGGGNLLAIADNAFEEWDKQVASVNVVRGDDTTITRKALDGVNIVTWGKASPGALAVTYIWYYPSSGEVVELDTIMNKAYFWTWSGGSTDCAYLNSYDAQNILTHEIGHWFGLDDEYDDIYADNTMYGYGDKWEVKKNTLTTGDIVGVKDIY